MCSTARAANSCSARNYTYVNWAKGVDMKTGRPITTKTSDWYAGPKNLSVVGGRAHLAADVLRSPTHLVYIPVIDQPAVWVDLLHNGGSVKFIEGFFTVNGIYPDDTYNAEDVKKFYGPLPDRKTLDAGRKVKPVRELIRAWDPVAQKAVWEHETSSDPRQ